MLPTIHYFDGLVLRPKDFKEPQLVLQDFQQHLYLPAYPRKFIEHSENSRQRYINKPTEHRKPDKRANQANAYTGLHVSAYSYKHSSPQP